MPVASFCASETAETGRIANGREQGDHVSRRKESFKVFCPTFCTLQKVGKRSRRRAAIGCRRQHKKAAQPPIIARSAKICCDSNRKCRRGRRKSREAAKGFNFVSGSCCLCVLLRGLQNLELPERETDWYFLRRAKSTAKTRRGLRPSGLPGTIQISARYEISAEMTGVHHVTGRAGERNLSGYRR